MQPYIQTAKAMALLALMLWTDPLKADDALPPRPLGPNVPLPGKHINSSAPALTSLIQNLSSPKESVRIPAYYALIREGTNVVSFLLAAARTNYAPGTVPILAAIGAPAVPFVIDPLKDPNDKVSAVAAETLYAIGAEALVPLYRAFERSPKGVSPIAPRSISCLA